MTDNLPAVYVRRPPQMSAKTWAWCAARWPSFADRRTVVRMERAAAAYERAQGGVERVTVEVEA